MNQVQPNVDTKVTQVVIGLIRAIGRERALGLAGNPEDWIYRAERYFTFLGFSEEYWLPLPSLYLDGEALEWFRWLFHNNQFFYWNHFKEKIALCFQKGTYTKSSGVDAQITSILALLQKIEDKYSFTPQQVVVEDTRISTATVFSGETASPSTEENSSHVDNIEGHPKFDTFIHDHSGHVDYMLDEMSNGVFTKEVEETSSASSFVANLDHIQPPKEFDRCFHSYGPMVVIEVQPDTHIKMLDEEASDPKHTEVQLFDEGSPKDMSKRYVIANSLDHGLSKQKIEFETFDDKTLAEFFVEPETIAEFFVEPETIEDLYLDNFFWRSRKAFHEEDGKSTDEFSAHNSLCQFSFNPGGIVTVQENAMNLFIWDPGITFKFKALVGTVNTKLPPLLLGSTSTFGFIDYANSMTLVWDPGLQSSRDIFPKWEVSYKMVVLESKVDDTYSEMNHTTTVCIAWLQGCIKSIKDLIEQQLRSFYTLDKILVYFDTQGVPACYATGHDLEFQYILNGYSADKFISLIMQAILDSGDKIGCPPTFSLYEFAALQTCENDHWSLIVIESELELVKIASIVAVYVVHKAMLNECKNIFILVSCGKVKTTTRLMRYLAHFRGHRRVKERIIAQQVLGSLSQHGIAGKIHLVELGKTYGGIIDAHDYVNIKDMKIVRLSKKEQMTILRIMASVMILGDWEFSKGSGVVSSIQQVDRLWFHLCSTITTLYTNSVLGRFNIILPAWFY
ncbi:hypothetical protein KY290_015824 [Solanum tuberosum]|uniref:Uncharacterized protein n=1 Tax=Solanum tuberosum TaxID=4113 RepID=A0ABQ7VTR8_SOLTU|nr:hypothetical protein KY289_013666 [Solanum tuberosum]KAH0716992.1 hypothetical protein KY285_013023 [Solanum tuberosum]KAH0771843.1 hypothetical protein KY290_015824 [Solanum tuberosum]